MLVLALVLVGSRWGRPLFDSLAVTQPFNFRASEKDLHLQHVQHAALSVARWEAAAVEITGHLEFAAFITRAAKEGSGGAAANAADAKGRCSSRSTQQCSSCSIFDFEQQLFTAGAEDAGSQACARPIL